MVLVLINNDKSTSRPSESCKKTGIEKAKSNLEQQKCNNSYYSRTVPPFCLAQNTKEFVVIYESYLQKNPPKTLEIFGFEAQSQNFLVFVTLFKCQFSLFYSLR